MSWQAYIDTSLIGSGHIDKGAIISLAGDSSWAASPGFEIKPEEMKILSDIVKGDQTVIDKTFGEGLYVAGERFVLTSVEEGTGYARASSDDPEKKKEGIVICGTLQAIIIAHHDSTHTRQNVTPTTQKLAEYLKGLKY
jgi:profilin